MLISDESLASCNAFNKYSDASWGKNEIEAHEIEIVKLLKKQIN